VLALVGGALMVCVVAWWRGDSDRGFDAVFQGIVEFLSRA
jgi:hypothetical protein